MHNMLMKMPNMGNSFVCFVPVSSLRPRSKLAAVNYGLMVWWTNYFSLFVSYRFTSNKTQLTEFPESKSDMPLFLRVLALK